MESPWAEGPKELLKHAIDHLHEDGDFDRRIALISIDNAVELMIKVYLEMPKRARGSDGPSRKELAETFNSFPGWLDLLEKYAGTKINGIKLAEIEWFHRLRNDLYHSGNGITVERKHVDSYLTLARVLFLNLFNHEIPLAFTSDRERLIAKFLGVWGLAEAEFRRKRPKKPTGEFAYDWNQDCISAYSSRASQLWEKLNHIRIFELEEIPEKELNSRVSEAEEFLDLMRKYNPEPNT